MTQSFVWKSLEYISNNQIDVAEPAARHFQLAERFFKFVSWILAAAALTFAANISHNAILWALCLYGYFRLVHVVSWYSNTIPSWFGPTDFSPKKKRTILLQIAAKLFAIAVSFYFIFQFQHVISGITIARCPK